MYTSASSVFGRSPLVGKKNAVSLLIVDQITNNDTNLSVYWLLCLFGGRKTLKKTKNFKWIIEDVCLNSKTALWCSLPLAAVFEGGSLPRDLSQTIQHRTVRLRIKARREITKPGIPKFPMSSRGNRMAWFNSVRRLTHKPSDCYGTLVTCLFKCINIKHIVCPNRSKVSPALPQREPWTIVPITV